MSGEIQEIMEITVANSENSIETMESGDTGEVQYVYDGNQIFIATPDNLNNFSHNHSSEKFATFDVPSVPLSTLKNQEGLDITDLVLEDGTRAMIVNGTLVTADGQTLILQDGSDLSQYYVDESTDQILISKEQEEQFLEIISSQNTQTEQEVIQYVQGDNNEAGIKEENARVLFIQEGDQVLPVQQQYQLAEVNSNDSGMPIQVVKLENQEGIDEMGGVIDLEQFLGQQGMVQLHGNYQYAILKDGKFHIQTTNEPANVEALEHQNSSNVNNEAVLEPSSELSCLDLTAIRGKDVKNGESISLTNYVNKLCSRNNKREYSNNKDDGSIKHQDIYNSSSTSTSIGLKKLINKKITIGKTNQGKLLVGKILNVTKKTETSSNNCSSNENSIIRNITIKKNVCLPSKERKKNIFEEAVKQEVISLVDDENTTERNKNDLHSENSSARTSTPQELTVIPVETTDQNNGSPQTARGDIRSVLKPASNIIAPNEARLPTVSTPSTIIKIDDVNSRIENEKKAKLENNVSTSSEQSRIVIQKKVVTKDCFDVITRTLTGLMNMESVVKKLKNKTLIIKIIEKNYDRNTGEYTRSISYCSGYMVREYKLNEEANNFSESWRFIPDANSQDTILGEDSLDTILQDRLSGEDGLRKIANLTIQITINPQGNKTTRVIINPPNMYKCKECPKSFRTSSALKVHVSEIHSPSSLETITSSVNLNNSEDNFQLSTVSDEKGIYECMECKKRFGSSLHLRRHMSIHSKLKSCEYCNQSFATTKDLKRHRVVHESTMPQLHPIPSATKSHRVSSEKPPEQKIFSCFICGRQFSRHTNLQRHIEIHLGEGAMYKCAICNCSYHYVSSLTRHVVTCHVDTTNKRPQNSVNQLQPQETNKTSELQFLQEDQIVEMIHLEDMSQENLQYVTQTMGNVTEGLRIGADDIEILQIPVDESSIVIED